MPWGNFPLIGLILGPICGFLQYKLLIKVVFFAGEGGKTAKLLLFLFLKLGLYALFLVPMFLLSTLNGAACVILAELTMVGLGIFNALRKKEENQ